MLIVAHVGEGDVKNHQKYVHVINGWPLSRSLFSYNHLKNWSLNLPCLESRWSTSQLQKYILLSKYLLNEYARLDNIAHFPPYSLVLPHPRLVFEEKHLWYSSIRSYSQIFHNMVPQWLFLRYIKWLWYETVKRNPFIFHMFLTHYLLQRKMTFFWCSKWSKPLAWIIELVNILFALRYHIGTFIHTRLLDHTRLFIWRRFLDTL